MVELQCDPQSYDEYTIPGRIVIGVTGHRELPPHPWLAEQVRSTIERIREMVPSLRSTPLLFTVLSPLAEGADRLVAREVLKFPGATLEAVLPMEKERYIEDFNSPESRSEFEVLLGLASDVKQFRTVNGRPQAYEQVGRYIVDQCDILLTLWDGRDSVQRGGTAEIVRYARQTDCPLFWIHTEEAGSVTAETGRGLSTRSFQALDEYNSERVDAADFERRLRDQRHSLVSQGKHTGIASRVLQDNMGYLLPHHVRADLLALRYQRLYYTSGVLVYLLATAAVAVAACQIIFLPDQRGILVAEVVLMSAVLVIVWIGRRDSWHQRWLDYRFLAERLRSALFISVAGIEAITLRPPRHLSLAYAPKDWMVAAFSSVWSRRPRFQSTDYSTAEGLNEFLNQAWLENQIRYQARASEWYRRWHQRLSRACTLLFALTLCAAVLHLVDFGLQWLTSTLALLVIALPATAASIGAIRSHRDYLRNSMRSAEMVSHLKEIRDRMATTRDTASVLRLVSEAEETMLRENEDWRVLVRFNPPELPV